MDRSIFPNLYDFTFFLLTSLFQSYDIFIAHLVEHGLSAQKNNPYKINLTIIDIAFMIEIITGIC